MTGALAAVAAVVGGGGILGHVLTAWTLPALSPLPWLGERGPAGAAMVALLVGFLLGLHAGDVGRALARLAGALGVGLAVMAMALLAPAGESPGAAGDLVALFVVRRAVVALYVCGPVGLLGAAVGAAVGAALAPTGASERP